MISNKKETRNIFKDYIKKNIKSNSDLLLKDKEQKFRNRKFKITNENENLQESILLKNIKNVDNNFDSTINTNLMKQTTQNMNINKK